MIHDGALVLRSILIGSGLGIGADLILLEVRFSPFQPSFASQASNSTLRWNYGSTSHAPHLGLSVRKRNAGFQTGYLLREFGQGSICS